MDITLMDTILRGLLPNHKDRFYFAQTNVAPEAFTGAYRRLWDIICTVWDYTGEIVDAAALEKVLDGLDDELERKVEVEELWEHLADQDPITEVDFRASVGLLAEELKKHELGMLLDETAKIIEHGVRKGNEDLRGLEDAMGNIKKGVADLEAITIGNTYPIVDMAADLADWIQRVDEGGTIKRFATGCHILDTMTHGGIGTGELALIVAYTGVGKSLWCVNFAHSFITQGHNVVYLTLETQASQIQNRFMVRHCLEPQFGLGGVSLDSLNKHSAEDPVLTGEELTRRNEAAFDMQENMRNGTYGRLKIVQIPTNARMAEAKMILNRIQHEMNIDVVIIDSIDMLSSDTRRQNKRDELNEIILAAKEIAKDFDNGRGVPLISPWQTSRDAYQKSGPNGELGKYDITALAETSEAERRADLILAIGEKPDTQAQLRVQTLKWRDGQPRDFDIRVDYDHCFMGTRQPLRVNADFNLLNT